MEQVIQTIYVNVGQPSNLQCIHAMQHDYESMDILAYVMDKNVPYNISDCDSVHIQGATANRMAIYIAAKTYRENQVIFTLSKNMLASPGVMELSIVFTKDGKKISTFPFTVCVANRPLGQMSKAEINFLDEYVKKAKNYYLLSKSFAEGDTGIRTEENTDNSKYYYQQIKKLIEDVGTIGGTDLKKKYYKTYADFKTEYDAGNIEPESLILISNEPNTPITPPEAPGLKSRFIAVGKGAAAYSFDGQNWLDMPGAAQTDYLYDVVYGNGKFVSICLDGGAYYSSDGETWKQCTGLDNDGKYQRLAFGNHIFMCVDYIKAKVFVSSDGETWENTKTFTPTSETYGILDEADYYRASRLDYVSSSITGRYNSLCSKGGDLVFFQGQFVLIIRTNSGDKFCYSEDGSNWSDCLCGTSLMTDIVMPLNINLSPNLGMCRFRALKDTIFYEDKYTFAYSSNGKDWGGVYNNNIFKITHHDCFTYENDKVVAVYKTGEVNTAIQHFTEGTGDGWQNNVSTANLPAAAEIGAMVYDGNNYIAFESKRFTSSSSHVSTLPIYVSPDGLTWTNKTAAFHCNGFYPKSITRVQYHNGIYTAIVQAASYMDNGRDFAKRVIFYSTDNCTTWNIAKDFNDGSSSREDMVTLKYIDTGKENA